MTTLAGPESIDDYYARLLASADESRRLGPWQTDGVSEWDIFPYVEESLQIKPLAPLLDNEPARRGEDPAQCWCAAPVPDEADVPAQPWSNDRWVLKPVPSGLPFFAVLSPRAHHDLADLPPDMAAEMGTLMVAAAAAVEALPSVGRAHVCRWGDGGAHLHLCLLGRPLRMGQFRGSPLVDWMEHLPTLPPEVAAANVDAVTAELSARVGGVRVPFAS